MRTPLQSRRGHLRCAKLKIFPAGAYQGALRPPGPPACRSGDGAEFLLRGGWARKKEIFATRATNVARACVLKLLQAYIMTMSTRICAVVSVRMRTSLQSRRGHLRCTSPYFQSSIPMKRILIFSVIPFWTHLSPRMNTF